MMRLVRISTLAMLGAATACGAIAERAFTRPTIIVKGVKVRSVGLSGGALEVSLQIANPNPYPVPVQRATYAFALADSTEVGRGQSATAFTLPAHDSTVVQLPIDVSWQGLRAAARDAARDGTVDYRLTGSVTIDTPVGNPNVPFESTGRFTPPPSLVRSMSQMP
ncbi:MAG TPA: LEA type 2 family protein [Gemmatimonadaceae bacterium]|nr:LEA type 2 family protein [Gemmatimonadaceae bacterium]